MRQYATTGGTRAIMEHLKTHNIEENSTLEHTPSTNKLPFKTPWVWLKRTFRKGVD
jgi:hypothetical protein